MRENGPVAQFEQFGFEARPEALGLRVVIAAAPAAVREFRFGVAPQGLIAGYHKGARLKQVFLLHLL
jgi:hypothetical protein